MCIEYMYYSNNKMCIANMYVVAIRYDVYSASGRVCKVCVIVDYLSRLLVIIQRCFFNNIYIIL